jgi:Co/Zn/Cd efflux system component
VNGVLGIHDLHIWQFVDGLDVSSVHIMYDLEANQDEIVERIKQIFHENNLHSITIQLEKPKSSTLVDGL